jgi:hypothetical protein
MCVGSRTILCVGDQEGEIGESIETPRQSIGRSMERGDDIAREKRLRTAGRRKPSQ